MLKTWIERKWGRVIVTHSWILGSTSWNTMTLIMIANFPYAIYENLYSQVDSEGHHFLILEEISDHLNNFVGQIQNYDDLILGVPLP